MIKHTNILMALAVASALSACGGGGGGGGSSAPATTPPPVVTPPPEVTPPPATVTSDLNNDCSGVGCGSGTSTAYLGSGTGIWAYTNNTGASKTVNVGVTGLNNNGVNVVITNPTATAMTLPTGSGTGTLASVSKSPLKAMVGVDAPVKESERIQYVNYVNHNFKEYLSTSQRKYALSYNQAQAVQAVAPKAAVYAVNDTLSVKTTDTGTYTPVATTLKAKAQMANGGYAHIWVETAEIAKLDQTQIDDLLADFATNTNNIVGMTTGVVGDYWGNQIKANNQSILLDGTEKDIHIVITNLTPDGQPFGIIGYFWALNDIKTAIHPASNGKLMFFIDSETLAYNKPSGKNSVGYTTIVTTLAHEFQHMIHFYQKNAVMDVQDDTWTDEMTSVMVEDVVGSKLVSPSANTLTRSGGRFSNWLNNTVCEVGKWYGNTATSDGCDVYSSYATHAAFGAYLVRQYGVGILQKIATGNKVGFDSVDSAIQSVNAGHTLATALKNFYASAYVNDTVNSYGFPALADAQYPLNAIVPSSYNPTLKSYSVLPATLRAYSSVSMLKGKKTGDYTDTITLPAGASVAVVVK